jgi:peptidoglycan/LPS O-acetylase OafA/YrhL
MTEAHTFGEPAVRATPFRVRYMPGFDGMRGAAVLALIVYHTLLIHSRPTGIFSGEFLWVEMFFVQSGFLITSLLLQEHRATGTIAVRAFYWRRATRLIPALLFVSAFVSFWLLTFSHRRTYGAWREVWTTVLYVSNWFDGLKPSPLPYYLPHTWSLAIEWQFYLVVPLLLLLVWRIGMSAEQLVFASVALALTSTALMIGLSFSTSTHRLYMGTDTRASALFFGMGLAAAAHAGWLERPSARVVHIAGAVCTAAFIVLTMVLHVDGLALYRGGFLLTDIAVIGMLVLVVREPNAKLSQCIGWEPLRRVGIISYGVYLWHWPIIMIISEKTHLGVLPALLLAAVITLAIATFSFRCIERPVMSRLVPTRRSGH